MKKLKIHKPKKILFLSGYLSSFVMFIVLYIIFLYAYLSPGFTALIDINAVGEAHVELVLLTGLLFFSLFGFLFYMGELHRIVKKVG